MSRRDRQNGHDVAIRDEPDLRHPPTPADILEVLESRFTEYTAVLRGLSLNDVLETRALVLDVNGMAVLDHLQVPFAAVSVANFGVNTLTVAGDAPATNAPIAGPGIQRVPGRMMRVMNLAGRCVTIYGGNAGDLVDVTVFTRPQQANASPVSSLSLPTLAANVLDGYQTFAATTGATTLITIPAGRQWQGWIGASCACAEAAAGAAAAEARAVFSVAGAGATPAPGNIFAVEALAGANAAGGTVGSSGDNANSVPFTAIAPAANAITVQVTTTQAGTITQVDAWAIGALQ